jgi:regulatory protein
METEFDRAREYVYRLLTIRPRTEKEIILKLKRRGFSEDAVIGVINLLKDYGYINDTDFARMWIKNRCRLKPMGKRRLYEELYRKGVSKETIDTSLNRITPDIEYGMARYIVDRKLAKGSQEPRKLHSFLLRRGFSNEIVYKIISELDEDALE